MSAPTHTLVKICGITRESDVMAACDAGADFVGFMLYEGSARNVGIERARHLAEGLSGQTKAVLVLVNADDVLVTSIHDYFTQTECGFVLQFHGKESPERCETVAQRLGAPYWRAAPVQTSADTTTGLIDFIAPYTSCEAILLDSPALVASASDARTDVTHFGGTGHRFDWESVHWSRLQQNAKPRLVLSGGLAAANVGDGVRIARPWAVDVSSGVEVRNAAGQLQRGLKSPELIQQFVAAVRDADGAVHGGFADTQTHESSITDPRTDPRLRPS